MDAETVIESVQTDAARTAAESVAAVVETNLGDIAQQSETAATAATETQSAVEELTEEVEEWHEELSAIRIDLTQLRESMATLLERSQTLVDQTRPPNPNSQPSILTELPNPESTETIPVTVELPELSESTTDEIPAELEPQSEVQRVARRWI